MAKVDVQRANPELYEQVKTEQERLKIHCRAQMKVARLCPYCGHKTTTIYKGNHGYADEKCPNCGEEVIFPPISFRLSSK